MAVNNELARPATEEDFEAMCRQLYRSMWKDSGCMRVGRSGQAQFGVDVLGDDGQRVVVRQRSFHGCTSTGRKCSLEEASAQAHCTSSNGQVQPLLNDRPAGRCQQGVGVRGQLRAVL